MATARQEKSKRRAHWAPDLFGLRSLLIVSTEGAVEKGALSSSGRGRELILLLFMALAFYTSRLDTQFYNLA